MQVVGRAIDFILAFWEEKSRVRSSARFDKDRNPGYCTGQLLRIKAKESIGYVLGSDGYVFFSESIQHFVAEENRKRTLPSRRSVPAFEERAFIYSYVMEGGMCIMRCLLNYRRGEFCFEKFWVG